MVKGYKATNQDMSCIGYQFELDKTFIIEGDPVPCEKGFHFCKELKNVFHYYPFNARFFEIEADDIVIDKDDKSITNKIRFVREITDYVHTNEELQKEAIRVSGLAIRWMKNPSEAVKKAAVECNGWAIQFIQDPSEELQRLAVQYVADVIYCIRNPSEAVQMLAVTKNHQVIGGIKNPTKAVLEYVEGVKSGIVFPYYK